MLNSANTVTSAGSRDDEGEGKSKYSSSENTAISVDSVGDRHASKSQASTSLIPNMRSIPCLFISSLLDVQVDDAVDQSSSRRNSARSCLTNLREYEINETNTAKDNNK
jgi:hypothetical protein